MPAQSRRYIKLLQHGAALQYDVDGRSIPALSAGGDSARVHQMLSFRTLEHTADVGFEAYDRLRREAFANFARALMNIIVNLDSIEPSERVRYKLLVPSSSAFW